MCDKTVVLNTPDGIEFFRLAQCKARLSIEVQTGMKMSSRGPTPYSQAKQWYGLKGSRESVLKQLEKMVEQAIADKQSRG